MKRNYAEITRNYENKRNEMHDTYDFDDLNSSF